MKIIHEILTITELKQMAKDLFGDMVKAVVDVDKELIAVDAELHSDLEAILLNNGSKQKNLWGINLYPEIVDDDFIEFDSMINIRPSENNKIRGIENPKIRDKIIKIVTKRIKR